MRRKEDKNAIYGFEEYKHVCLGKDILSNYYSNQTSRYCSFYDKCCTYQYLLDTDEKMRIFEDDKSKSTAVANIKANKSIIANAKTFYAHPSCKIARTLVAQKFRKALSPLLADIVIVPEDIHNSKNTKAVFVNDESKTVVEMDTYWYSDDDKKLVEQLKSLKVGTKLSSIVPNISQIDLSRATVENVTLRQALDTEFQGIFTIGGVYNHSEWLIEYAENIIPRDRVVFENDVLAALGNEDNKPTYENMISLSDMLKSDDHDVLGAALKALSSMDYVNYPNSFKLLFYNANGNWTCTKIAGNTAVKYMTRFLGVSNRGIEGFNDKYISQEDYDLFIQLKPLLFNSLRLEQLSFMYADQDYVVHPRIKK